MKDALIAKNKELKVYLSKLYILESKQTHFMKAIKSNASSHFPNRKSTLESCFLNNIF